MMANNKKADPLWLEEARRLRSEGVSFYSVAKACGTTNNKVKYWLNEDGYREKARAKRVRKQTGKPSVDLSWLDEAKQLRATGMSPYAIGIELGKSHKKIKYWLNENNYRDRIKQAKARFVSNRKEGASSGNLTFKPSTRNDLNASRLESRKRHLSPSIYEILSLAVSNDHSFTSLSYKAGISPHSITYMMRTGTCQLATLELLGAAMGMKLAWVPMESDDAEC